MLCVTTKDGKENSKEQIPAYRDTFVHFLFGTPGNEPILLHFLNAVLENDGQAPAKSVEARNPFNPATFLKEKYTILDVKATEERGDIFVVEFQTSERAAFADRMTYYACKSFGGQMLLSAAYSTLNAVIAIAVTTYEMFGQLEGIHNTFRLTAKADHDVVFTDSLQMHVLEASKEKIDRVSLLPNALGAWINFFYYSHRISEDEMTTLLQGEPRVQQAYVQYKQFNQDDRLRAIDEAHQIYLHDLATDMEEAHEKGKAEGKAEAVLRVLRKKFKSVPVDIEEAVVAMSDLIALESLLDHAIDSVSLDEFATALQ
jgi:predicted transposase/invertase (TIGR01784 family)